MPQVLQSARHSAVLLLDQVIDHNRLLGEALASGVLNGLDPADRARAQRLATETLRGLERADRLLQKHLRKYPPTHVRNVLRLATVELAHGGDAHGVVNEAVNLCRRRPHKRQQPDQGAGQCRPAQGRGRRRPGANGPAFRLPRLPTVAARSADRRHTGHNPPSPRWRRRITGGSPAAGSDLRKTDPAANVVARLGGGTLLPDRISCG